MLPLMLLPPARRLMMRYDAAAACTLLARGLRAMLCCLCARGAMRVTLLLKDAA